MQLRPRTTLPLGLAALLAACSGGGGGGGTPAPVANNAPTAPVVTGPSAGVQKHPLAYDLAATDPDGDAVTFTTTTAGATIAGTRLTFLPPAAGAQTFEVRAQDAKGGVSAATLKTVTATANGAPVFTSAAAVQFTNAGSGNPALYTYAPTATDPETDEVVFTLVPGSVEQTTDYPAAQGIFLPVVDGTITVTNAGATSASFGVSSTVLAGATAKRTRFKVRAQDRLPGAADLLGAQTDLTVTMTVLGLNLPPVIQAFTPPAARVNHPVTAYQLYATDPNADALAWSLVGVTPATPGITLTAAGFLSWNPIADTATRTVTLKVADGRGGEDQKTFTWTPLADTPPAFSPAPAFTDTVGGVAMHEPQVQRANLRWRERFHYSDPLATDAEFSPSTFPLTPTGWRARLLATDAESDAVRYTIKAGSVLRFGVPYTATGDAGYPAIHPDTGELTWKPNGRRNTGADPAGDAVAAPADPANWAFTVTAQQMVGGQATPGGATEVALSLRVLPNDLPRIGPLQDFIGASTQSFGVTIGGGTGSGQPGRPHLQGLLASDTATPGTPARFVWKVLGPGVPSSPADDYGIWDPDATATSGHMDALQVDFGTRTLAADGQVGGPLGGLQAGKHHPALDTTGNLPAVLPAETLPLGFYSPWLQGTTSPGAFTVAWAPVRSQYQVDRYLGGGQYSFPLVAEDQYAKAAALEYRVGPLFGSLRFGGHRIRQRSDTLPDAYAPKGTLAATGNTRSGGHAYVLSYLPEGYSTSPLKEESAVGILTYGAHLFGTGAVGGGAPASGYSFSLGAANPSAGNWLTPDGAREGADGLYPPNPLNETLHAPAHAAGAPGTAVGGTLSLAQWTASGGAAATPALKTRTLTGPYADALAWIKTVPSNAGYLFSVPTVARPWAGDGQASVRQLGVPAYGNRWVWGRAQSEVSVQAQVAGRPVLIPQYTVAEPNVDNLGVFFTWWSAFRITFTWPATVSQTGPGFPAAGAANAFQETDLLQVATPNLSGNARFFVTGNTPGVTPQGSDKSAVNYFGKYGFTAPPAAYSGTGALRTVHPHQPVHAVTNALWVPNNADGRYQLPNAYTTPAGGGQFCDIPWVGIRGYLAPAAAAPLAQVFTATDLRPDATQALGSQLAVGIHAANPSPTGLPEDAHANPALLDSPVSKDRVFFLWMKQASGGAAPNAYGAWGGSVVAQGATASVLGGATLLSRPITMGQLLTNPLATVLFAAPDGLASQAIGTGTGLKSWRRSAFEGLAAVMGAPAGTGRPARVRVADPAADATAAGAGTTAAQFDSGAATLDGLPSNTLVVYGLKDRSKTADGGVLGEAGIEPGSPVLAQWWNTGHADVAETDFPGVIRGWASAWLPPDFTEVVHLNHAFVGRVQYPGQGASDLVAKVLLEAGAVLPKGHALLADAAGFGPVVTPVRQIQVADLKRNTATGTLALGTRLDLFLGSATELAQGGPTTAAAFKLEDGNATGADHRLGGSSTWTVTFQPSATDPRSPSGYLVSLYRVTTAGTAPATTGLTLLREVRLGHQGGAGALQRLFLPSFASLLPALPGESRAFVLKVRTLWMEGDEGPAGTTLDLAQAPFSTRFPMAWADALSGVFVVAY